MPTWSIFAGPVTYSRKVWWVESLMNLANHLRFTKLKPFKPVITINEPLADPFIHQTFSAKRLNSLNILPAKPSRYTVINNLLKHLVCPACREFAHNY